MNRAQALARFDALAAGAIEAALDDLMRRGATRGFIESETARLVAAFAGVRGQVVEQLDAAVDRQIKIKVYTNCIIEATASHLFTEPKP